MRGKAISEIFGLWNLLGSKQWLNNFEWDQGIEGGRKKKSESQREFEKNLTGPFLFSVFGATGMMWNVKKVADDTDWSDFADLIREEGVHLANEASNLLKH